ncbi:MAG: GNAT family N-acetyltransferase [Vicinamibacterales bacterium]
MTERATDATITPADVTLRRALSSDAAALAIFAARTFEEAFGAQNRPEDMAAHLATHYGPRQQAAEIADPETVVVVMESGEGLVAYAKVRRSVPPPCVADERPVELHRFYVDRRWHGRGLAGRLMDAARRAGLELGGRVMWLSVWEQNPRAIAFYAKVGFRDVGSADFHVGSDRQTDRILVTALDGSRSAGGS